MRRVTPLVLAAVLGAVLAGCDGDERQQLGAELEELRQQNAALKQQLDASKDGRTGAESRISELTAEVQAATERLSAMLKEVESGKELLAAAESRYQQTLQRLEEATTHIDALRDELSKTVQAATAATERYEGELARLRDQVADLTAKLAEALRNPGRLRNLLPGGEQPPSEPR